MGVSPSKSFGDEAIKVIQKDVYISASGQKELATFAAGWSRHHHHHHHHHHHYHYHHHDSYHYYHSLLLSS